MIRKSLLLAVVVSLIIPAAVFGADKLIVQNSSSVTQFVVTDTGTMGLGTGSPSGVLEIRKTGSSPDFIINRTDGATFRMYTNASAGFMGTKTAHPFSIMTGNVTKLKFNTDGSIQAPSGARLTAAGVWTDASSREFKENINVLKSADANEALKNLTPVTYNYKVESKEKHVGFIAEDVPELVSTQDRKSLSPMDIVAVLTRVVKDQKQTVENLEATVARLEAEVNRLKNK
jgi:hypothetical protein